MKLAVIEEQECIGCNRCVDACPVYAIIGAKNFLHTVNVEACIGCMLCEPVCPVDCISSVEVQHTLQSKKELAERTKDNYLTNQQRLWQKNQKLLALEVDVSFDDIKDLIKSKPKTEFKIYE